MKRSGLVRAAALSVSLSACAVGPNYTRPTVETPASYRGAEAPLDGKSLADLPWWEVFQDPTLKALVEEALAANYDARIAATRVERARYAVGVTRADLMPQADYTGAAERGKFFVSPDLPNQTGNVFLGAFQMAWEIDVWGRIRRATEASLADLFATEDVRRGVVLTVITDVAQAYFELRELDLELEIARRTRDSFQQTLDLFVRRLEGGVGSKLATSRAEAALADAAATIPELEQQIVAKENQLSILLGRPPGEIARGATLTDQPRAPDVPPGLPSALLERRPDVLAAEQNVVATNALVGVAVGNFLPRFGLTSLYGGQSGDIDNVVKSAGNVWLIAGSITGPLFQGGRLYYNYKGSVVDWQSAVLAYEQTVLNALGDVSNALVARQKFAEAAVERTRQVSSLQESVRVALVRFTDGFSSYFEVLDAQQLLFPAELLLARNELNQLVSVVQLYRALGGGWRQEEAAHPDVYPLRREVLDAIVPQQGFQAQP
ncbi:MAG TPA: efflux transporter outer membrane subunit [Candidatus Binatia bacterium]|nr:efflux transporter outer membrane subunit [Candidatus Binatia bacterium]